MANYDKIARYYDVLSRLIFFRSQLNAQIHQLKYIQPNSSILIVGGGTGWILEEITKCFKSGLAITYLEISQEMILLAKNRATGNNQVDFACIDVENFYFNKQYDFVLTPFLFDNFSVEQVENVFAKLNKQITTSGKWLMVDFSLDEKEGQWWRKVLLKVMYSFFNTIGIVKVSKLINLDPYFVANNFLPIEQRYYYKKFIKAVVYSRVTCLK